ncbi:hypothetical protein [Phenylobacterium sp.]|uniref:DUF6894 family protein n=1 Tax=Phenylobacterium sp. TaxID=1871053 RepID=UPI00271CBC7C|nr:hypothetical protein [Phenylobacterium sp.]MDO8801345.1 hypothetical protein [Phenylobacterium sp.]
MEPTARREAVRVSCEMLRMRADEVWLTRNGQITVTDEMGLALFTIGVSAQLPPAVAGTLPWTTMRSGGIA